MDKLISIVIPTYNRKKLTDRAVQSIVSSFPNLLEIIVVDDCCSEVYDYGALSNSSGVQVRIIRLNRNVGAGMARRAGVEEAHGKFIAFLDSDDTYDVGWMDHIISMLHNDSTLQNDNVIFSGIADEGKRVGTAVRKLLAITPKSLQLAASRVLVTIFNPFYTPTIVLHKDLCFFQDSLRHCEDYYSIVYALFGADNILLPPIIACHLGRTPSSAGGESSAKQKMYRGELKVRFSMLRDSGIPFRYKLFMPFGIVYQWCRTALKQLNSL